MATARKYVPEPEPPRKPVETPWGDPGPEPTPEQREAMDAFWREQRRLDDEYEAMWAAFVGELFIDPRDIDAVNADRRNRETWYEEMLKLRSDSTYPHPRTKGQG